MSLHRKDDWDEALEEAHRNDPPPKPFIPGPDYDYGMRYACDEFLKPLTDKMRDILRRYSCDGKVNVTQKEASDDRES